MRVYIVGAPDTDKTKLAYAVKELSPHLIVFGLPPHGLDDPAIGPICDYRTELIMALDRMKAMNSEESMIFTHSLIDSVAHIAVACYNGQETFSEDTMMTFLMTAHTIAAIMRDSFKFDYVFFKPGAEGEYNTMIETALLAVLDDFKISYIELNDDFNDNLELINDLVQGREVGQRDDNTQLDGND